MYVYVYICMCILYLYFWRLMYLLSRYNHRGQMTQELLHQLPLVDID